MQLLASPPLIGRLLFASEISGIGIVIGRLAGTCIISLAVAWWPLDDSRSSFYGMLTWSVLAMLYLIRIGIRGAPVGILLWPAVVVHAAIAAGLLTFRLTRRNQVQRRS